MQAKNCGIWIKRAVVGEAVAEPEAAADHLGPDRGQKAEDRAHHEPDDDHGHRHRDANLDEDLQGRGAERSGQRDLREIGPPEACRRVDHDHRPAGERHGDDARAVAEAQLQDEQGYEGQHRRRHQEQDVGGDDLLDERELGDEHGQEEADRGTDGKARDELDQRVADVRGDEREALDEGSGDQARPRHDVGRHPIPPQRQLGAADDEDRGQEDRRPLRTRADHAQGRGDAGPVRDVDRRVRGLVPLERGNPILELAVDGSHGSPSGLRDAFRSDHAARAGCWCSIVALMSATSSTKWPVVWMAGSRGRGRSMS